MNDPVSTSSRTIRAFVASAVTVAMALTTSPPAWGIGADSGSGATTAGSEVALQVKAQELAAQIQADGQRLDQLAESFDAAVIRSQQLAAQQATLEAAIANTNAAVAAAKQQLKDQALLAYLTGGAPVINYVPDRPGSDPSLTISYAEIIAGGRQRAIDAYHTVLQTQATQSGQLVVEQRQAAVTVADIKASRTAANATMAAQRQALAQVKGKLATLVAQVREAQQRAEEAAIQARAASQPAPVPSTTTPAPARPDPPTSSGSPTTSGAPTTSPVTSPPTPTPTTVPVASGDPPQAPDASAAIRYARAQLGKPYQWGGAGPDSFDCSGLTMMAWEQAGVYFPHLAQDQYDMTARIALGDALPGDLIFFGTPDNVYHVGLYIGNGQMIDAPETGENVSVSSIYWSNLLGAGRVVSG
jgi:peptidoglycan DL-endopeptidase CwlO